MKKFLVLMVILLCVSVVSAALDIQETSIQDTTDPGRTIQKQITLKNTGSSDVNVIFTGKDLICTSSPTKKITAVISDFTILKNSTVNVPVLFSVPANQLGCIYFGNIIATGSGFSDGVTAQINVNSIPSITIVNTTTTIMKNLSTITYLKVAITNTGNTNLNLIYQYGDLIYGGSVLAYGSAGTLSISVGETKQVTIAIPTNNDLPDGEYTSTFEVQGGYISEQRTLRVTLKSPKLLLDIPEFIMPESERNKTVTKQFVLKNSGDYPINSISLTTNADPKYNVIITGTPSTINPGAQATITISAFVPEDEKTTVHKIGDLFFNSNKIIKTLPLSLDVNSMLEIDQVIVKIGGSSNKANNDGETIDDEDTNPGSEFEVSVKVCNRYEDSDYAIEDVFATVTFEGIDDGDDLEGETESFDLDGKKCVTKVVEFDSDTMINYLTETGTYDLVISVEGDDVENDITQEDEWTVGVKVFRAKDTKILFDEIKLAPSTISCGSSTRMSILAYNVGDKDTSSKLTIKSADLGIDITKFFKIGEDTSDDCDVIDEPDERCIGIDHLFTLPVPYGLKAGTYDIEVTVYRDETRETDKEVVPITINCDGVLGSTTTNTGSDNTNTGTDTSSTNTGSSTGTNTGTTTNTGSTGTSGGVIITTNPGSNTGSTATGTPVKIKDISKGSNALWTIGLIVGIAVIVVLIVLILLVIVKRA